MPKSLGQCGEEIAVIYLKDQGFKVIATNVSVPKLFEIDILALKDSYLVIVEVKTRSSALFGGAVGAINKRKQEIMLRSIPFIRSRFEQYYHYPLRFDAIAITMIEERFYIKHYQDCLEYDK